MRNIDRIHFQGRCDRAHCAKAYNHSHPPLGELRPELEGFRRRKQTFYVDNGGRVQNLMTVNDLLLRLIQLPKDAIVGYEEEEILVVDPTTETDTVYVVASKYNPDTESFLEDNVLIKDK